MHLFFLVLFIPVCLLSCSYEIEKGGSLKEPLPPTSAVTYQKLRTRILQSKCTGSPCHGSLVDPDVLSYESFIEYADSVYKNVIKTREMPPAPRPPLTEEEYALVKRWFEEGMQP